MTLTSPKALAPFRLIKSFLFFALVFLVPLFFLPLTQEYFVTNKLYFLAFGSVILIAISGLEFLITKELSWKKGMFDSVVMLFLFTVGLSTLLSSPNKIQALLSANLGLLGILSLTILYFYMSRSRMFANSEENIRGPRHFLQNRLVGSLSVSAVIVSIITILFYFNPLKSAKLPVGLQFLQAPNFNTVGTLLDLSLFLGFFAAIYVSYIMSKKHADNFKKTVRAVLPALVSLFFVGTALALSVFALIKSSGQLLPPFSNSWYAAVEILKNPMSALFGIGVDNFSSIFAKVKDASYNASSSLWQIQSFNTSRSALLHVFTELGLFGLLAILLLLSSLFREVMQQGKHFKSVAAYVLPVVYLLMVMFLFPSSFIVLFLLFVTLIVVSQQGANQDESAGKNTLDLTNLLPVYLGVAVVIFLFAAGSAYGLGRTYMAELSFKKSINGLSQNNLGELYNNQRDAIIINPFIERFRTSFAQTNLLVANNVALKASQGQQLTEQERQTITQAIQAAIAEAKAAVTLNPAKAANWESLAIIYRNILNVVQGADVWTVSSYQRAILLDPQNPQYRLNLGGVYYSFNNFDEALKFFEQAIAIKPDWNNGHYNVAWAAFQKGDYQRAVNEMQNVLLLIDPKKEEGDYRKAQSELEEFKKKLPNQQEATQSAVQPPQQLALPTPPATTISPRLQLPKEASPEER